MASYDPELIAAIDSASARLGPFELTRQFLYFYMSERAIFDDRLWECVHDLSESSFSDADYWNKLDRVYNEYGPDYSDESDLDPRKEPERWNQVATGVTVMDSLLCGVRDSIKNLPFHACYNVKDYISGVMIGFGKASRVWIMRPGSVMASRRSWLPKLML